MVCAVLKMMMSVKSWFTVTLETIQGYYTVAQWKNIFLLFLTVVVKGKLTAST